MPTTRLDVRLLEVVPEARLDVVPEARLDVVPEARLDVVAEARLDVVPEARRTAHVPADVTLAELRPLLQAAVGWTDSHPHQRVVWEERYGPDDDKDLRERTLHVHVSSSACTMQL